MKRKITPKFIPCSSCLYNHYTNVCVLNGWSTTLWSSLLHEENCKYYEEINKETNKTNKEEGVFYV